MPLGTLKVKIVKNNRSSDDEWILMTQETSNLVQTWNHTIKIKSLGKYKTKYTDLVEIHAGFQTLFLWCFAHLFFSYRQKRWKGLINSSLIGG